MLFQWKRRWKIYYEKIMCSPDSTYVWYIYNIIITRSRITWAHGSLLYHSGKVRARHTRVSVSSKGCVKIKNIQMEDSGTYTCMGQYSER